MVPDLDELLKDLAEANENLSRAFIRQSLAWNKVDTALREIRENLPNLFTEDWDSNRVAMPPIS